VILPDTSAWVEFDRATGSPVDLRLTELIDSGAQVAVTDPVIMEIAGGARDDEREVALRRMLGRFTLLRFEVPGDFDGATRIYRRCRSVGVTPRGMLDCMIAAVARRHGAALLADDADLQRIAGVIGIELDQP
jgi:predicted nucleic acid-binding protein